MKASPLWIRRLEGAVTQLQVIPLWGHAPAFPWGNASEKLKELFHVKSLHISSESSRFLNHEELLSSLGQDPFLLPLTLMPLSGTAYWAMPRSEMEKLSALLLTHEVGTKGFISEHLSEGYSRFLLLKALHTLNEMNAFGDLTVQVASKTPLPTEGALCLDISIDINRQKMWGRLICSNALIAEFKSHFLGERPSISSGQLAPHLPLPLAVEVGSTTLSAGSWKKVKKGDLILLDRASYDPNQNKGTGTLTISGMPLFDVRLKDNEIKILEYAFFQEEAPMTRHHDEPHSHEESGEEKPLWSANEHEQSAETLLSSREIPLTVTVEVARLTLPLEKVVGLQPGNVLDLKVSVEGGVSLTVHGQSIAKGELVKIGESIGVKILAIH